MSCVLFGADARARVATLLSELQTLDDVSGALSMTSDQSMIGIEVGTNLYHISVAELRGVFDRRKASVTDELERFNIKLRDQEKPAEEPASLPSIARALAAQEESHVG